MPTVVSVGQITITDQNDYIFTGSLAPSNPIANLTLWIDTSTTPSQMKRWNGSTWEIVNDVKIGGTNILPNSSFEDGLNGWTITGSSIAASNANGYLGGKCLYLPGVGYSNSGLLISGFVTEVGQVYTFSAMVKVVTVGSRVVLGWKDSITTAIRAQLATYPLNEWKKAEITFTGDGTSNPIYLITTGYEIYVDQVKFEKGNKATDWSPSPNDIIKIGARNLLRNSGIAVTNTNYNTKNYNATLISPNTKYTIVVKANVSAGQRIGAWWNGGALVGFIFSRVAGDNIYIAQVTSPGTITAQALNFYNYTSGSTSMTIYYACLYEGHISPPIDWIPAPEDTQSVIDDLASDNRITPSEKIQLRYEFDKVISEYPEIQSIAESYVLQSLSDFEESYNDLDNFVSPLLLDMGVTSDVNGQNLRVRFSVYYGWKAIVQSDISKAIQGTIDNQIIGGENLSLQSDFQQTAGVGENYRNDLLAGSRSITAVIPSPYLINGKTYVFSVDKIVKNSGTATGVSLLLYDYVNNSQTPNLDVILSFSTSSQIKVFTIPATGYWSLNIYCGLAGYTASNDITFSGVMLQEGNKATSFNPATRYLTEALKGSTEVSGGLVTTNVMLLKDSENNIKAGISGLEDNLGMWAGGNYNEALLGFAKVILRKDGSGQMAGGNILWDIAGNLLIKGIIEASAGKVGGLNIFANSLSSATMKFSESAIESLSSLLSPGSINIARQASWTSNIDGYAYTQNLVLSYDCELKFKVTTTASGDDKRWIVKILDSLSNEVYKSSGSGVITSMAFTVNLPAGTYVIESFSQSTAEYPLTPDNYVNIKGYSTEDTITAIGYASQTKIGNDGFYSFWNTTQYLYFSSSYGFELRVGGYGIQVTATNGVRKLSGGSWVAVSW